MRSLQTAFTAKLISESGMGSLWNDKTEKRASKDETREAIVS